MINIFTYQQPKNLEQQTMFATVGAVYADGVTLIFPGSTEATLKRYKKNSSLTLAAGDRVKILKVSGTFVVEYKI